MLTITLDFNSHGFYTGHQYGREIREALNVDEWDSELVTRLNLIVPESVKCLSTTFLNGLFGKSIVSLGHATFKERLSLKCTEYFEESIDDCISFCRNAGKPLYLSPQEKEEIAIRKIFLAGDFLLPDGVDKEQTYIPLTMSEPIFVAGDKVYSARVDNGSLLITPTGLDIGIRALSPFETCVDSIRVTDGENVISLSRNELEHKLDMSIAEIFAKRKLYATGSNKIMIRYTQ